MSCILHYWVIQLILAYSWARPAILVAGKGRGECFYFFRFFIFIPVPLSSLFLSFSFSTISFLPFSRRRYNMTHKGWSVVKPQHSQSFTWWKASCFGCNINTLWNIEMVLGRIIDEAWMLCSKQGGRCYRPALLAAVEGGVNVCIFYYFCVDICFFSFILLYFSPYISSTSSSVSFLPVSGDNAKWMTRVHSTRYGASFIWKVDIFLNSAWKHVLWYSEGLLQGLSNEYQQQKNNMWIPPLIWSYGVDVLLNKNSESIQGWRL